VEPLDLIDFESLIHSNSSPKDTKRLVTPTWSSRRPISGVARQYECTLPIGLNWRFTKAMNHYRKL
jgi:hypothetical protein